MTRSQRSTKPSFGCLRPHRGAIEKNVVRLRSYVPRLEMETVVTLHRYLFIGSAIAWGLYPLRAYWRIYELYKRVDEQTARVGFFWFSFYVQSPWVVRGAELLERLPQDLRAQALAIRSRQTREINALLLWIVILVLVGVLLTKLSHS